MKTVLSQTLFTFAKTVRRVQREKKNAMGFAGILYELAVSTSSHVGYYSFSRLPLPTYTIYVSCCGIVFVSYLQLISENDAGFQYFCFLLPRAVTVTEHSTMINIGAYR